MFDVPISMPLNLVYEHNDTNFDQLILVVHILLSVSLFKQKRYSFNQNDHHSPLPGIEK